MEPLELKELGAFLKKWHKKFGIHAHRHIHTDSLTHRDTHKNIHREPHGKSSSHSGTKRDPQHPQTN